MTKKYYEVTQSQLSKLAYNFSIAKNIKNIFSSEKGMAEKYRNPGISFRLPEPTGLNSVLGFIKFEVIIFFVNLETLWQSIIFQNIVFYVNETGISNVQQFGKCMPQGNAETERGNAVTVVYALRATGKYLLQCLFSLVRQSNILLELLVHGNR